MERPGIGDSMLDKLVALSEELNQNFKEREEEIAGSLLALFSGEHVLFLGPPGTAKSLLARNICSCIEGGQFYQYLLTRFTTPEEVFGPLSLAALQKDAFNRKIAGYLPTANVAFLDEIFKANSSILNSLLTVLNERKFHNGSEVVDVPLLAAFGASNELPEENESLEALYDRYLFRYFIRYIQDETNFQELILEKREDFSPKTKIALKELEIVRKEARDLEIEEDVLSIILTLRKEFKAKGYSISDRRWKKILNVFKVAAAGLGRKSVDRSLIPVLQHMTWDKPDQKEAIRNIVIDLTISGGINLDKLKKDVEDLRDTVEKFRDYTFPKVVICGSCKAKLETWNKLTEHKKKNQDHNYSIEGEDSDYYNSNMDYDNLLSKFKKLGWQIQISLDEWHAKKFNEDMLSFDGDMNDAKGKMEKERDRLKDLLAKNLWICEKDRRDVMDRYDNKIKTLHEIEGILGKLKDTIPKTENIPLPKKERRGGFI